ncbi:hypothetical protein B0H17DRAFT_1074322, partial [Mycena rosella]
MLTPTRQRLHGLASGMILLLARPEALRAPNPPISRSPEDVRAERSLLDLDIFEVCRSPHTPHDLETPIALTYNPLDSAERLSRALLDIQVPSGTSSSYYRPRVGPNGTLYWNVYL